MTTTAAPKFLVRLDEYGDYFGRYDDSLLVEMRGVPGVPDASYEVCGEHVFVFNKLLKLVEERRARGEKGELSTLVAQLLPQATVSPLEAVTRWEVVPEPYRVEQVTPGVFAIRHVAFNAWIPGRWSEQAGADGVMARLLVGDLVPGAGDVAYLGQPMELLAPFSTAHLPRRPTIAHEGSLAAPFLSVFWGLRFEPGFDPVTRELFDCVAAAEGSWAAARETVGRGARDAAPALWQRLHELGLESLNDIGDAEFEFDEEDARRLRALYPELTMLSERALYEWFDAYQRECLCINGWVPERDESWLFYLMGSVINRSAKGEDVMVAGYFFAYAVTDGMVPTEAMVFAREAAAYDEAIGALARQIRSAVRFLAQGGKDLALRGRPIRTLQECFAEARVCKFVVSPLEVTQRADSLTACS